MHPPKFATRFAPPLVLALLILAAIGCTPAAIPPATVANPTASAAAATGQPAPANTAADAVVAPQTAPAANPATPGPAASVTAQGKTDDRKLDVIEVSGHGVATGVPDLANLSLGVSVTADSVSQARSEAAASAQSVIEALTALSIPASDIATVRFTIRPDYDYVSGEERFRGYRVSNQLRVIIRNADDVGPIIDASIAAAGDNIVFNGLDFSFSDTAPLQRQARESAVEDMAVRAEQLAEFSGRELGDLIKISEGVFPSDPYQERYRTFGLESAAAAAYDTPTFAGQEQVTVQVHGVYELR